MVLDIVGSSVDCIKHRGREQVSSSGELTFFFCNALQDDTNSTFLVLKESSVHTRASSGTKNMGVMSSYKVPRQHSFTMYLT